MQEKNARNSVFLTLCIMGFFAILSSTMSKSPVLKPFTLYLNTPTDWVGFVPAVSTIPGILVSLPAASLSDIYGRKKFLLIAGVIFASAPFLYLLITVWWQLILVRFYHGFATAIFVPVAEASIAELSPAKRGERISLFSSVTYVGRLIAPTLGGSILFLTGNSFHKLYLAVGVAGVTAVIMALPFFVERKSEPVKPRHIVVRDEYMFEIITYIVLVVVSIIGGLVQTLWWLFPGCIFSFILLMTIIERTKTGKPTDAGKETAKDTIKNLFRGWGTVARNHGVLIVSFVQACQYYVYGAVEYFLAGYLPEVVHLNEFLTGITITSIIGVAIFARPYMGRVSDRIGRRVPIVLGCIISGLPLLAIPFVSDFRIILLLVIIYGFGFATVTASTSAAISELVPEGLVGTSMGFLDTVMDVGQTLGPMLSGLFLSTSFEYRGIFPSLTIVLMSTGVIFALYGLVHKKN